MKTHFAGLQILSMSLLLLSCSTRPIAGDSCGPSETVRMPNAKTTFAPPPQPIEMVSGNAFYSDNNNSIVNEDLYRKNEEARKPLRDYLDGIIRMTDLAVAGNTNASLAVETWLSTWAEGKALTRVDSQQGGFERKWVLSGLIISYKRNSPYVNWQNKEKIETWLNQLTHLMMAEYQSYSKSSQKNNHVYWAGLVAIEMASVNSDQSLMRWGLEKIRFGIQQIDKDGFLPLELERKGRALQYHRVSAEALLMAAYFARLQGVDLFKENNSALDRLVNLLLRAQENPEIFYKKTGVAQDFDIKSSMNWLVIYSTLKPESKAAQDILAKPHSTWNRFLGGNIDRVLSPPSNANKCSG